jgi:hypothetical protein
MHMVAFHSFHSDGTVEQSNPEAGDPNASDSNLMGAWTFDGTASATFFDASGRQIRGPIRVRMEGERVQP